MQILKEGKIIVGVMLKITQNPAVLHIAKNAGIDFLMIDMEHGSYSYQTLESLCISSINMDTKIMVRVPELQKGYVSRALDCGAKGVMVPMIETRKQASMLSEWSKYKQIGNRGMSVSGAHTRFNKVTDVVNFSKEQNDSTLCIAQIETKKALDNIDQIAKTKGIDVLLIGPNDLSLSLGCPGEFDSDIMQDSISRIALAAKENNKIFGMHSSIKMAKKWIPHGLRFIMVSTDSDILFVGMEKISGDIKNDQ